MRLHATSRNWSVAHQAQVLVFETNDGQVFIRRGEDEVELTIHEYDQLVDDIKAGKLNRPSRSS